MKAGKLMTVAEVAEHFGVSESRARHLMSDNGIQRVCGYPADQVRAISRPGQGARTDLQRAIDDQAEDLLPTGVPIPPRPHFAQP